MIVSIFYIIIYTTSKQKQLKKPHLYFFCKDEAHFFAVPLHLDGLTKQSLSLFYYNVVIGYKLIKILFSPVQFRNALHFYSFCLGVSPDYMHHTYNAPFSLSDVLKITLSINTFFYFYFFYQTHRFCCYAQFCSRKSEPFFCCCFDIYTMFIYLQYIRYILFHSLHIFC